MKKLEPVRSILEGALKHLEIQEPLKTHSIWGAWQEIVGETIAGQAQPEAIRNHILFVKVSHPAWVQQLQFLKTTLLEQINTHLGAPLIQDIRFRLGKISAPPPSIRRSDLSEEALDEETSARIERILQRVEDPETKKILRHIFVKGARVERSRQGGK